MLQQLRRFYSELSPAWIAAGIFVLAFGVRMAVMLWFGLYREAVNFTELEKIAHSLAEHNTFADPYKIPTGPSAHGAPIFPFLLSLLFRFLGYGVETRLTLLTLTAAASSLQYALLPGLAASCGLPRHFAVAAGLFGALIPMRLLTEFNSWETCFAAAGWVAGVRILLHWWEHPGARTSVLCGLWWGGLFLLAPQMLAVFGLALLGQAWAMFRRRDLRGLRWQAIAVSVAAMVVLPWTVRNYVELGGLFVIRDNFWLEISVGNFPGASPFFLDNYHRGAPDNFYHRRHPFISAAEAVRVREMGEVQFNRWRKQEVMEWIRQDPGQFVRRTLNRIRYFWFMPSQYPKWKDWILFPITAASFYGLYRMIRRAPGPGTALAAGFAGYPLVYYLTNLITRYRFPIEWSILFLAAFAVMDHWRPTPSTRFFYPWSGGQSADSSS